MQKHSVKEKRRYRGFPQVRSVEAMVDALLLDPPADRWKIVREILRIETEQDRQELIQRLQSSLHGILEYKIRDRIKLALMILHDSREESDYCLIKGRGLISLSGSDEPFCRNMTIRENLPVVDFHIHPRVPDFKLFYDMKKAGITHGVILAEDTDPGDLERPEIREKLRKNYVKSALAGTTSFDQLLKHIKAALYPMAHVSNSDVAAWVDDYPDALVGFGSVNPSKSKEYVEKTLEEMEQWKMKGIKLVPYSQFFNPGDNGNMNLIFDFCRRTGFIILSHCGCGPGPFEVLEFCGNSHPEHWERLLRRYPEVPVVLAHAGSCSTYIPGIWLYETLQMGKKYKNLYVDLAGAEWVVERENIVGEIRKTLGFNRVLFGTDYPNSMGLKVNPLYSVSRIRATPLLSEKEKQKVLGGNAARMLKL